MRNRGLDNNRVEECAAVNKEYDKAYATGPSQVYMPTIEEKLNQLERDAKDMIHHANSQLTKVARIKTALKKNPALSDLYTLMKF